MRRRVASIVTIGMLSLAAAMLSPSAAIANPTSSDTSESAAETEGYGDCAANKFCGWDGADASGLRVEWTGPIGCEAEKDLRPLGWGHRIDSFKNNTGYTLTLMEILPNGNPLFMRNLDPGETANLPAAERNRVDIIERTWC
ncbi:MAG: peptidase inhibitor family I36 protein [Stackebrandtia sp.]